MSNVSRVLNMQALINYEFPGMPWDVSTTIAQQAEIEVIAAATDDTGRVGNSAYLGIYECALDLMPDFLALDCAFLAIALIEADRKFMANHGGSL